MISPTCIDGIQGYDNESEYLPANTNYLSFSVAY